jgi:hypothetical protein
MLLILLLRDKALPAIERFLSVHPASSFVSRENGLGPTDRAWELLREATHMEQYRAEDWRLCGRQRAEFEDFPFTSSDILGIADAYEWCLMPWGTDYTGIMIALVSADDHVIRQAKEILSQTQCADLTVSHYTRAEVANHKFRGAVFNRGLGVRGEGVWERNACPTAVVFTAEGGEFMKRKMFNEVQIISEDISNEANTGIPVRRQWIRMSAGAALLYYARFPYTVIIAAGDVNDDMFVDLLADSKKNGQDPLRFGLAALQSASWIYIPKTERLGDEIYINRNPQETAKLLADERVASAPRLTLRCFC